MFEQHLQQAGLTRDQAAMYETLVRNGPLPASTVARESNVGRTLAYVVLEQLEKMGLVEKRQDKKLTVFVATHPLKLQEHVETQKSQAEKAASAIESAMPELTSAYNLASGKPGVRFFEGLIGMKQVLDDSLTSRSEIYSYADLESIDRFIPEINRRYVQAREQLNIRKKGLILDTPQNREFLKGYYPSVTEAKFIQWNSTPFKTIMQIYDGKVSYLTLGEQNMVGIIIADPHIYTMHKALFEFVWNSPLAYDPSTTASD